MASAGSDASFAVVTMIDRARPARLRFARAFDAARRAVDIARKIGQGIIRSVRRLIDTVGLRGIGGRRCCALAMGRSRPIPSNMPPQRQSPFQCGLHDQPPG